ncbi:MAG: family 10 glycosylhydrolase [Luteitalea sp.]|nr:family 10 glycosylhydrolase [Luteitalea sp.]
MRLRRRLFTWLTGALVLVTAAAVLAARGPAQGGAPERHSIWVHPPEVGRTPAAVRAFVEQCRRAHIETVILLVKGMNGEIYWPSRRFADAVVKGYESFDLLRELRAAARPHGIKVHAWLVDFVEGVNGAAVRAHPEWAQLNPAGGTTATETLGTRRRPYPYIWMCPARRPGYTDQWLLPMIEELARHPAVDGIHHDYVRYPGDVAPDSFCFCDYCLAHVPRYAMLAYETRPAERYDVDVRQERVEANWWTDPTMLPRTYSEAERRARADFLLNGRTIPGGSPDVRYFFYDYRVQQINNFVREVHELVKRSNPKLEISAAVFKNPVQSARFIGQQWHRWNEWIDIYTPMTYRSHFAGSFEAYLDHLEETTRRQLEWTRHGRPLEAGIATTYLYREELQPFDDMNDAIDALRDLPGKVDDARVVQRQLNTAVYVLEGASGDVDAARQAMMKQLVAAHDRLQKRLAPLAPDVARHLDQLAGSAERATPEQLPAALASLSSALAKVRADLPPGFCPPEKLIRAIDAARRAQPDGIVIFAASSLTREKLWPALEKAFTR